MFLKVYCKKKWMCIEICLKTKKNQKKIFSFNHWYSFLGNERRKLEDLILYFPKDNIVFMTNFNNYLLLLLLLLFNDLFLYFLNFSKIFWTVFQLFFSCQFFFFDFVALNLLFPKIFTSFRHLLRTLTKVQKAYNK